MGPPFPSATIRLPDSPLAKYERQILIHLRGAAWTFAVVGDTATVTYLLRLEGRTPADRIPAEIDRLRKAASRGSLSAR